MVRLRPVWMTNHPPSVLWHCWLGHQTCKNRRPYNLYCVGADVKPCSINVHAWKFYIHPLLKKLMTYVHFWLRSKTYWLLSIIPQSWVFLFLKVFLLLRADDVDDILLVFVLTELVCSQKLVNIKVKDKHVLCCIVSWCERTLEQVVTCHMSK